MTYISGFVTPVKPENKDAYIESARMAWPLFQEFGALSMNEGWGDNTPDGKVTDFRRAVQATAEETVVFSWVEWPSREARDAGMKKVMEDPRIPQDMSTMPFDGKRMIYGGFQTIFEA